jgi:glucoamylase
MSDPLSYAFGWPGIDARWTSSAKSGVGTAIGSSSRVWFTLSHGILNEIYYPRIDLACVRDMGLMVTDGKQMFAEEKRGHDFKIEYIEPAIPAFRLVNTADDGSYRIEKEIIADPARDAVLQWTKFVPLSEAARNYHLYVLLAPHLRNRGAGNTGLVGDYKGVPMLFATRAGVAVALASSASWLGRSAGFVGYSDGWQDLDQHKQMTWHFDRAENGNVALVGEIDWRSAPDGSFVMALGFGTGKAEAGHRAYTGLLNGFEKSKERYLREWRAYHNSLRKCTPRESSGCDLHNVSASVLRIHEDKRFPGGLIASLSIPWGFNKGDDDLGGYHLVWPRDLVESTGGLLAAGARADAARVLNYLLATQEADGHWAQNQWLDGTPYWSGSQMDETAFPILLVDLANREEILPPDAISRFWPKIRKAAQFIVCNGPITQQDRWEEDPGYSPFTLAAEIAALLAAADLADANAEHEAATYLRETADAWNSAIERWTYARRTELAKQLGIEGYYVRITPPETSDSDSPLHGFVPIKNRPPMSSIEKAAHIVSPDALALVRFGLRAADDPRIVNTIKAIDTLLKVQTPFGPAWHRYNDDGYGEHEDGAPFDGTGIGRAWPLLAGERGHYELAAGRIKDAELLLNTLEKFANETGLISEQVWDTNDIGDRGLTLGRPSGSAMPLVWAHSEYLKLRRSLEEGRVFDMPPQTQKRYLVDKVTSNLAIWRFNHKCRTIQRGKQLRIEALRPFMIHWSTDNWMSTRDCKSRDTKIGMHVVDLPTQNLQPGQQIYFTFYWPLEPAWEKVNYSLAVTEA